MRTKINTDRFINTLTYHSGYPPPSDVIIEYPIRDSTKTDVVKSNRIRPTDYRARYRTARPGDYYNRAAFTTTTGKWFDPPRWIPHCTNIANDQFAFNTSNAVFQTALDKAYSDLREGKLSLGLELSQARQTASFIGALIKDTATVLRAIKTGRFTREAKRLITRYDVQKKKRSFDPSGTFANRWLEYQFAAKPLMGLVSDSIDRYTTDTRWDRLGVYAKGLHKSKDSNKRGTVSYTTQDTTWEHVARYHLYCNVTSPTLFTLNSVGMGYRDVAAIIWDIIPYSFVLDWFLPVSRWLNAYAVQQGLTVDRDHSYWTQRVKGVYHSTYTRPNRSHFCDGTFLYMQRRRIGAWTMPSLRYKPDWLNAWTVTTAGALLNQSLRR